LEGLISVAAIFHASCAETLAVAIRTKSVIATFVKTSLYGRRDALKINT